MAKKANIGASIGLDGEKEFKAAVSGINKDVKVLASEMKKVTAEFSDNKDSIEALTAKNDVLNKQVDTQREKINSLKSALENAKTQYGENSDKAKEWQISLNNAEADLYKLNKEVDDNKDTLEKAINPAKDMGNEIEKAGDKADKSGGKFDKLGEVIKASAVAMGAVAVAAGAAAVKMGKEVVQQFGELEQNLGGSEAVFGQYAASIQKTGENAYKNLGVSQSEYLATANKMGALFQGSGVEQQKSLELTEKSMQRAADMASVMGIDMSVAMESIAGAAKGNYTMMDNLGVAMNETTLKAYALSKGLDYGEISKDQSQKAELAMQMFFEKTEQYSGNFAKESTETVSGSIGLLQAALGSFTAGLGNTNADMQNLTGNLVDAFGSVVDNVVPIVKNLTSALPEAVKAILSALGELMPTLLETAVSLFREVLQSILSILPELIPVVVETLTTVVDTLIENLPMIIDGAFTLIMALADGIILALPKLIPSIVDTVLTIVDGLIDNIDMLIDASIAIIMALAEGLIEALPTLIDKIPVIIEKLIVAITDNLPKLIEMGITLAVQLGVGLIKAIPQLLSKIPKIISSIVGGFANYYSKLGEVGLNMVKGLWNGIKDATSWILDKIKGFGKSILDGIKGIFGIHSPSTVFRDEIGKNLALGLGEGFTDEMNGISKAMVNAVPTNFDINGSYNLNGSVANGLFSTPYSLNFNLPIYLDGKLNSTQVFSISSEDLAKAMTGKTFAVGAV